jgi:hypothetical protein
MLSEITNSPRNISNVAKPNRFATPVKTVKATPTKARSSAKRIAKQTSSSHFKAGLQRQNEVELTFSEQGPLGITFGKISENGQAHSVLTIHDGQAVNSGMEVHDVITAVGDVRTERLDHDSVFALLTNSARPLKVTVLRTQPTAQEAAAAKPEPICGQMVRTGNLQKLSTKNLWQKRSFQLNSLGELRYFSGGGKLGGLIDLTQCFGIEAIGQSIRIQMDGAGETNIKLRANSKAKAADWVRDIEDVTGFIWARTWSPSRQSREQQNFEQEKAAFQHRRHKLQLATTLTAGSVPRITLVVDGQMLRDACYALGAEAESSAIEPLFADELEEASASHTTSTTSNCTCDFPRHVMLSRSTSVDGILRRDRTRSPVEEVAQQPMSHQQQPVTQQEIKQLSEDELIQFARSNHTFLQRVLGKCTAIPTETATMNGRTVVQKAPRKRSRLSFSRKITSSPVQ